MIRQHTYIVLLITLTLGYTLKDMLIYVMFETNRETVAELWCENKDRPDLHCNGQCVFMKAIQAEKLQSEPQPISVAHLKGNFEPFVRIERTQVKFGSLTHSYSFLSWYNDLQSLYHPFPLIKPPQLVS